MLAQDRLEEVVDQVRVAAAVAAALEERQVFGVLDRLGRREPADALGLEGPKRQVGAEERSRTGLAAGAGSTVSNASRSGVESPRDLQSHRSNVLVGPS